MFPECFSTPVTQAFPGGIRVGAGNLYSEGDFRDGETLPVNIRWEIGVCFRLKFALVVFSMSVWISVGNVSSRRALLQVIMENLKNGDLTPPIYFRDSTLESSISTFVL